MLETPVGGEFEDDGTLLSLSKRAAVRGREDKLFVFPDVSGLAE